MPIQHTNRKGKTYNLHQGVTKTGKPKYFFSPKAEGNLVATIPEGYEIYENPNAQVYLIREQPKLITDADRVVVEKQLTKLKNLKHYRIDVKGKTITIFESNENIGAIQEIFSAILSPHSLSDSIDGSLFERMATYSPIMRFILESEDTRTFIAQRYCFRGSIDDWIYIGGPDLLAVVAKKSIPHLGRESFYELY